MRDVEPLEEALIHEPPDRWLGRLVARAAVASQAQGSLQLALDVRDVGARRLEVLFGSGDGTNEAVHLGLEEIKGNRARIVGLHEGFSFAPGLPKFLGSASGHDGGFGSLADQFGLNGATNAFHLARADLEGAVEVFHPGFDGLD